MKRGDAVWNMTTAKFVNALGGESGWQHPDTVKTISDAIYKMILSGMSENEAREIMRDVVLTVRGEYGE